MMYYQYHVKQRLPMKGKTGLRCWFRKNEWALYVIAFCAVILIGKIARW